MRTNIELDDILMAEAMEMSGLSTKKAMVQCALEEYVRIRRQHDAIDALRGMGWDGDIDEMRDDWSPSVDWGVENGK
ncbi:transcriptional regulator [Agrobacterium rubi]|uniref:type II toxin-antitoxin system VapB family antitoxin n=1 Tax=Agrobacterium rubi TaxID=28099 RepID=UPI00201B609C|nr:type II toxin-antitoxin system VapB family antitoxin [Agrobacterium rubi]MCL6655014.1 transcriptional regulator [Agrobacterium rubi]